MIREELAEAGRLECLNAIGVRDGRLVEFDFDFRRGRRHGHFWHLDSKLNSGGDTTAAELVLEGSESAGFDFDQRNNRLMWLTSSSKFATGRLRCRVAVTSSEIPTIQRLLNIRLQHVTMTRK
ncbi:hypothetical protein [Rhizobium leguminosarum]|uniref:hypothetical protein n=1 Tax=Rhizobium leguminosarum TaxID=384 RepID=UPI001AEC4B43|nr:hypothetical protein [Rhizobium leguminosarum]